MFHPAALHIHTRLLLPERFLHLLPEAVIRESSAAEPGQEPEQGQPAASGEPEQDLPELPAGRGLEAVPELQLFQQKLTAHFHLMIQVPDGGQQTAAELRARVLRFPVFQ